MDAISAGFQKARDFIRPAVVDEQQRLGEEEALAQINNNTFEPRHAFTVKSAAFMGAADKIITTRTMEDLDKRLTAAMLSANGDVGALTAQLEKIKGEMQAEIVKTQLPGLAIDFDEAFRRGADVATRRTAAVAAARVRAQHRAATDEALAVGRTTIETLAISGATAQQLDDAMNLSLDQLSRFGPRGEFEVGGVQFKADPTRMATLTAKGIEKSLAETAQAGSRLMIEAQFGQTENPSAFVEEFAGLVYSGNSPLGAKESLELLKTMRTRAYTAETRKRAAAEAVRGQVETGFTDTINAFITMSDEGGQPIAVPEAVRAQMRADASGDAALLEKLETQLYIADSYVATHGMDAENLRLYMDQVGADARAIVDLGGVDIEAEGKVLARLMPIYEKLLDGVDAETIGLPLVDQSIRDGTSSDQVNYEQLIDDAQGNADLIAEIRDTQAFHKQVEMMAEQGFTAQQRHEVIEGASERLANIAAKGGEFTRIHARQAALLERLAGFSEHQTELARTKPVEFASSRGIALDSFEGAETLADVGAVIVSRVAALAEPVAREGFENPVPLEAHEISAITAAFEDASVAAQVAFLGVTAGLGVDQANAIFEAMGQSSPALFISGSVYAGGNQTAAETILRGSADVALEGTSTIDMLAGRSGVMSEIQVQNYLTGTALKNVDETAKLYGRGLALARGETAVSPFDLEAGYQIALGRQQDGTGGVISTMGFDTIAPPGWDRKRFKAALDVSNLERWMSRHGTVVSAKEHTFSPAALRRSIDQMKPLGGTTYLPIDRWGDAFSIEGGGVVTFDMIELEKE